VLEETILRNYQLRTDMETLGEEVRVVVVVVIVMGLWLRLWR